METVTEINTGHAYVKNGRFYGVLNGGEWAYYDPLEVKNPWQFIGGVISLLELEKVKMIVWYDLALPSGKHFYLPKLEGKFLTFVYNKNER